MLYPQNKNNVIRQQFSTVLNTPAQAVQWMLNINGPHDLEVPKPRELDFRHHGTIIGNAAIGVIEYSTLVSVKIENLEQSYSVNLPLYGEQSIEHQGSSFVSNSSVGAILSPNQSLRMTIGEKCRKKMVKLSRRALEVKLSKLLGRQISQPILFEPMVSLDGAMQQWWQMVENFQEILQAESSLCDLPDVWSNLENSLITSLLFSQRHNYFDELLARQTGRPQYLAQLETMFNASLELPLTLEDLERAVGVSRERLYRDFHTHYGMTPIAYFRQLRFEQVRLRLTQARSSERVSSIAMDYGFQQFGRFSKEYKERFGELPSQTLKLHRAN
ncbi:HTH-type transcriptional activator RhaR [Pseudomonas fluorescens]|uniref:HTH-type transcriptional activator RhaR n=1 Tax=Pseudomonas fluorescens TaxID=294 RepID=A0A5E7N5N9_PSEFL|nr:AraC family transcriptional regulator [Pseudomonas fluorescens]VVM95652.1 HTH-type transcriptional activator RhaR [Pseudomonas fluorescens]VVP32458.1 HTH-type transcriptional activator RhaR [Pseudomonas fluorescens]